MVENNKLKRKIREIIEREEYDNYTRRMSRQWTADLQPLKTNYQKEYLTDAPYLILIFKQVYGRFINFYYLSTSKFAFSIKNVFSVSS